MRLSFQQRRRFAAIKNESRAIYGSTRAGLIPSLFLKKSAVAAFGPCPRLVKVVGETEASFTAQLPGQNPKQQDRTAHEGGCARALAGLIYGASGITGGTR